LSIVAETAESTYALIGSQETGGVREIVDHPPAEDTDEDGDQAFNDEDPSPSLVAAVAD
jgi:hypothetical protein